MRGAGDRYSVGERIAFYRVRRGQTQAVLAGLVGRSEDWLSKVERGERHVRRLDVLTEVAKALRVSLPDLLGQPVLMEDDQRDDDVPAVRDALMSPRRLSRVLYMRESTTGPSPLAAAQRVESAWGDFQDGRLSRVIAALPQLITAAAQFEDAQGATATNRRAGWAVSARTHHLAATALAKIGESDLAWIAAERAMQAADQADDPLVLASAARSGTHALLAVGRYNEALDLGRTAASWLRARMSANDPEALSLVGMLDLRTAVAAAKKQDRSTATELLDQASVAADRLGRDANFWQTGFGPTNVALHRIAAALELGDIAFVVEHGPQVHADHLPTERNVSHRIDLGRAMSLVARDDDALDYLLAAEQRAPQLVRHNASVRETVKTMHRRSPASGRSSSLMGLVERCRAIA